MTWREIRNRYILPFVPAPLRFRQNSLLEISIFYRSWSLYLDSGQSSTRALEELSLSARGEFRTKIQEVFYALRRGKAVNAALRSAGFPLLDTGLIEVAETTGSLPDVLKILSQRYEDRASLLRAIKKSMTKPGLIFFVSTVTRSLPDLVGQKISPVHYAFDVISTLALMWFLARTFYALLGVNPNPSSAILFRLNILLSSIKPIKGIIRNSDNERLYTSLRLGIRAGADL